MRYRQFVRIERPETVSDGGGGVDGLWVTVCERPARIERVQSMRVELERVQSGAMQAQPPARIHMRADDQTKSVRQDWRIVDVDAGTVFAVNFTQDLAGDGREICATCTEGAST